VLLLLPLPLSLLLLPPPPLSLSLLLCLSVGRSFFHYCVALFKHTFSCFPLTISLLLPSISNANFNNFVLIPCI
jgi:hypothetical protein